MEIHGHHINIYIYSRFRLPLRSRWGQGSNVRRCNSKFLLLLSCFCFSFNHVSERSETLIHFFPGQLWCAIAPKWVLIRIVCYYVTIW